ncbi:MAG TPA: WhiB family transcriptional regulator [Patescibacteria group bacterium]|nr:WhiB family transcriptional regulator [Patescibacteria group bacterium]
MSVAYIERVTLLPSSAPYVTVAAELPPPTQSVPKTVAERMDAIAEAARFFAEALRDEVGEYSPRGKQPWKLFALCTQLDPDLCFPEDTADEPVIARMCDFCQVQNECLSAALSDGPGRQFGVQGGLSAGARRAFFSPMC